MHNTHTSSRSTLRPPRACSQVDDDFRRLLPESCDDMVKLLSVLDGEWPVLYSYDACPKCNLLFRCEHADATE